MTDPTEADLPVGTLRQLPPGVEPTPDWRRADGANVRKSEYPELYEHLQGAYGQTEETFWLPDMRHLNGGWVIRVKSGSGVAR